MGDRMGSIPNHVAIILDGNGRWAKMRGLSRSLGHKEGFKNLKKLSKHIFKKGVKILSVYAFSTENFKRDKEEVDYLMNLLVKNFKELIDKDNEVKIVFSGRKENLREDVLKCIDEIEEKTRNNNKHIFNICFNYGGRAEIIDATKNIVKDVISGKMSLDDITEENYINYLYNKIPDIDLLIRTSGEVRLSNYMLYQNSYSEMYFPEVLFPDFNNKEFDKAIEAYNTRDRRFGEIKNVDKNKKI